MSDSKEEFKEELKQFIMNHYIHSIIEQFKGPKQQQIYQISLTMDLSLIIDTRPMMGSWIINFYPHFLLSVHQIIYSIVQPMDIGYEEFICETKFVSVPTFDTAIHSLHYKQILMRKSCGSLIHIKNCIIVKVDQPKNYLFLQEYRCLCSNKISIKGTHLIQRLQSNYDIELRCQECGSLKTESEKKYKLCQKLQLYLQDLQPLSQKFNNFQHNSSSQYKHQFQLLDMYVDGNNVNRFQVGNQIYSLAYYTFNLNDNKNQLPYVVPNEYCYAVTIDQYTSVLNKKYFQKLKMIYKFQESQQVNSDDNYNENIKNFLDKSKKHYNYGKENSLFVYQTLSTSFYIGLSLGLDSGFKSDSLVLVKLTLLASIFLQNSQSMQYYLSPALCQRSNILVQRLESEQIHRHLHVGIIYEDYEILMDLIKQITKNLDNLIILPECDEETFDYILMSLARNGILIIKRMPNKGISEKIRQILKGNPVTVFKDQKIEIHCSIWCLFDIQDLKIKQNDFAYIKEKYTFIAESFDIVIDMAYSNLHHKQVKFNLIVDYCDQLISQSQKQQEEQFQTTIKKPTAERSIRAPSSCYLLQKKLTEKNYNPDLEQWINQLLTIDGSSLDMIKRFYLKLRQNYSCPQNTLSSLLKMSQAFAIMRFFVYSQIDDADGLYSYMITQKETLPLTYSDSLLAILLAIETRINTLGPIGAIFGSDTTNYLLNCLNPMFTFRRLLVKEGNDEQEDPLFENFTHIYEKVLNFTY